MRVYADYYELLVIVCKCDDTHDVTYVCSVLLKSSIAANGIAPSVSSIGTPLKAIPAVAPVVNTAVSGHKKAHDGKAISAAVPGVAVAVGVMDFEITRALGISLAVFNCHIIKCFNDVLSELQI